VDARVSPDVRAARVSDARDIASIYAPIVRDSAISFETEPPDEREMRHRIEATLPVLPWLVCERGGEIVGYGYASAFHPRPAYRWATELSVYVAHSARGAGVGGALGNSLLSVLTRQGFVSAIALIALPNAPSVGLFESLGFVPVGTHHRVGFKLGRWYDVGRWERPLAERSPDPSPPVPFARLGAAP
jgi:phosphinothricin acetyltransferase